MKAIKISVTELELKKNQLSINQITIPTKNHLAQRLEFQLPAIDRRREEEPSI